MIKDNTQHWIDQKKIQSYLLDVRKYDSMTKSEEIELIKKIKAGCKKSKELLIYSNLRFVIKMAKQYQNQGLDLTDLISEGNYGLLKAAERYDYEQTDVRFLSYAIWWVKQTILQSLHENSRIIRLPVNVINDVAKQNKNKSTSLSEFNYDQDIHTNLPTITRLDSEIDTDGGSLYDIIEDVNAVRPDVVFESDNLLLADKLKGVLNNLNDVEKYVVTKYFGLDGDCLTLQDISNEVSLTKERVRQIKEKAIKKLRFHSSELFELL
jgi:RNA polymerase primary sigma factor